MPDIDGPNRTIKRPFFGLDFSTIICGQKPTTKFLMVVKIAIASINIIASIFASKIFSLPPISNDFRSQMNLRAIPEKNFLLKYLLIGIGCLGFAAYSLYDGLIAYPAKLPRAEAFYKLKSDESLSPEELNAKWTAIATENGWSPKRLTKSEYPDQIRNKIVFQWVFLAIGLGVGIPCLIWYFKNKGTWIEQTEDGLRHSSGKEVKISQITKFDKKKWLNKGIGVIHYEDRGAAMKFVVDDLKYNRKTMDEIVCWLESQIEPEMIVNGKPESAFAKPEKKEDMADAPLEN